MEKQPASKNYFFDKGYRDVGNIIKKAWKSAYAPLKEEVGRIGDIFESNITCGIITSIADIILFPVVTVIYMAATIIFSALLICSFAIVGFFAYLFYSILYLTDTLFCVFKRISSSCSKCQSKFLLPVYECPNCGEKHTKLRPSSYGILKRKCLCGYKLPTTFFNGRQRLEAKCPVCNENIKDGGHHSEVTIPIVGGRSAGKTCFITQAISALGKEAYKLDLEYKYSPVDSDDDYVQTANNMNAGYTPDSSNNLRLRYYQFYLSPKEAKIKNLISLCDIAGEVYSNRENLNDQIGYKYANAFLMIVDPLSVSGYAKEMQSQINLVEYGYSNDRLDEILSLLTATLENMFCISSSDMLKTTVAVVFSKGDIPGLDAKIGKSAVKKYMKDNNVSNKYDAQNAVCEEFLKNYGEANFLNTLKSRYKNVQFFTSSALGHNQNGKAFVSDGVQDPILWLVDSACSSINLKDRWGKKL